MFAGPYVLNLDPVFAEISGISFWYHGLAYALGFLCICLWLLLRRTYIGLSSSKIIDLSIILSVFGLLGGRSFAVFLYEPDVFHGGYLEMACFWQGGMALTGVMAGIIVAVVVSCLLYRKRFLIVADEIVIPLSLLLLMVRVGSHLNGEMYGSVTGIWLGVKFPYADGFRHPVALYEALKYFIMFLILLSMAGNTDPGQGKMTGHFLFWSGLGSFFIDYFNAPYFLTLKAGSEQAFYMLLIILGLLLIVRAARKKKKKYADLRSMQFAPISFRRRSSIGTGMLVLRIILFAVILVFCLTLPSGTVQQSIKDPASRSFHRTV